MRSGPGRPRRAAVACAAGAACAAVLAVAAPASAQTAVRYVALGDSYTSGVGAGGYLDLSGACDRSADAYPRLWDDVNQPAAQLSVACSGASIPTVISSQLPELSATTTLVSITIGGNDVGFTSVLATCVLAPTSFCVSAVGAAESEMRSKLPGQLNSLLADIAADAPSARVVLLGYPRLYDLSRSAGCIGLSSTDRADLNAAADDLDSQLRAAAGRYDDVFADVRPAFAGHLICDPGSWLHSVDWLDLSGSYHPTAAGQAAYYRVLSEYAVAPPGALMPR